MKNKVVKPIVLILFFFGALITFSILSNRSNEDLTTNMAEATLPTMHFYDGELKLNELHGYVRPMEISRMRDAIIPVNSSRILSVGVDTYGVAVDKLSYEIRGIDGERLLADGELTKFVRNGNLIQGEIQVQNLLEEEEEYNLIFTLESGEKKIYYYTRLMQTVACHIEECLEFARQFHAYTFKDKEEAAGFIPSYMDPATGDATTLDYVDLTCTLNQIIWADFPRQKLMEPQIFIREINDSYNVITFRYAVTNANSTGESEIYNVEEYYRLRYTPDRMYVLNFERRMGQLFRGENTFLTDSSNIQLGIRSPKVEYASNESGDIVAFVQEGELWCFNIVTNELVRIFSFRGAEGLDSRENWNRYEIKIVGIDEAGSVGFIVLGYMNRGEHEGEVGVGVYHYDGIAHTIEEEAFIPVTRSYEMLTAELGQLLYKNDKDKLYLMLARDVYQIDLPTLKVVRMMEELDPLYCASSVTGRYFAWMESESPYSGSVIKIMDLKEETVREIQEGDNSCLQPLGFIDEDFIYGIANRSDVYVDAAGNVMFPMSGLKIMDLSEKDSKLLKEYTPSGRYIRDITIEGYTIEVELMEQRGNQFVAAGTDTIMNREAGTDESVTLTSTVTEIKETQRQLTLKKQPKSTEVKLLRAKSILLEQIPLVEISIKPQECFYVYQNGNVLLATESITDAILLANEKMGIVVDSSQQYVWMRARKSYQSAFPDIHPSEGDADADSIVQCVSAMLIREGMGLSVRELIDSGQTPKEVLESVMKDYTVLDLTGCTFSEILYYVSNGSTVFAMTGEDSAVLVVGYSANNLFCYDPRSHETESISYEDADALFADAGNIFFSYLR